MSAFVACAAAVSVAAPADAAAIPSCDIRQTAITAENGPGLSGHVGFLVHVVNTAAHRCLVSGYPRVNVLDASGHRLQVATPTKSGYIGGLSNRTKIPVITLRPGDVATSLVEGVDPTSCGTATTARVGLPQVAGRATVSISGPSFDACPGLQVHPLIPGTNGSSGF